MENEPSRELPFASCFDFFIASASPSDSVGFSFFCFVVSSRSCERIEITFVSCLLQLVPSSEVPCATIILYRCRRSSKASSSAAFSKTMRRLSAAALRSAATFIFSFTVSLETRCAATFPSPSRWPATRYSATFGDVLERAPPERPRLEAGIQSWRLRGLVDLLPLLFWLLLRC